jgi:hypothetical protein
MWGKRSWDNFHGSWGKRWPGDDMEDVEEDGPSALTDEQLTQLASLMMLTHADPQPPTLSEEEQKRSWSNLRGAWGKRGWSNFKGKLFSNIKL